jgi:hypothetical protein
MKDEMTTDTTSQVGFTELYAIAEQHQISKENARSRNHYGRDYTRLKVENHQQKVHIDGLTSSLEKCKEVAIKSGDRAFMCGTFVGIIIATVMFMMVKGVL